MLPVLGPRHPIIMSSLFLAYYSFSSLPSLMLILLVVLRLLNPYEFVNSVKILASYEGRSPFFIFFNTINCEDSGSNTLKTSPNEPSPIF